MAVAASAHHRSSGSITQKSQVEAAKQIPIQRCVTVFWEAKLVNFDNANPWCRGNGGRRRVCALCPLEGWECYVLASGCRWCGAKCREHGVFL